MRKLSPLFVTILLFLCQSCAPTFKGPVFSFSEIQIEQVPSKDDYPDANAVYLHREAKYEIQTASTFSEHIVIRVLKEGGKKYANIRIPFWKEWDVLDLKARTIKPNGEIINVHDADIFEVTDFPEYIMYADRKAKVFTFPAVDTGCILEYIYTLRYKGPYVPLWYFQGEVPTYYAKFTYDVPIFLGFDYIISALSGCTIEKNILDKTNRHKATFTARGLPAIKAELLSPPLNDISSWIMMSWASFRYLFLPEIRSGQESWYEIGKNYYLVTDTLLQPNEAVRKKTEEIVVRCSNNEEKIKKIFKFVQNNCRYIAVDVAGHRIIPNAPEKVLNNQYGDCKDLSGLFISMSKAVDIAAYPVLIKTKSAGKFIEKFPTPNQINHVAVAIPLKYFEDEMTIKNATVYGKLDFTSDDDYVIADPTISTYPLGKLHSEIQGRCAILCAGLNSDLIVLPPSNPNDNFWSTRISFNIDSGDYNGEIKMHIKGEDAALLRYRFLHSSNAEINDFMQHYISEYPLKIALDTFELYYVKDLDSTLTINLKFKKFNPLQTTKNQILIPVMFKSSSQFKDIYSCRDRIHNIEFAFPNTYSDVFKVIVPENYMISSLPQNESINNPWCEYTCTSYVCGDTITVNRNVAIKECVVPKENFQEIQWFAAKVLDSSHKIVILSSK